MSLAVSVFISYDIVGLHLISAKKPPGSTGPLPSAKEPVETSPFKNHNYSRVNLNRPSKKASLPTKEGSSNVARHGTVNGIVAKVDSDVQADGGGAGGGATMIETLGSRFNNTLQESQQSAEITK